MAPLYRRLYSMPVTLTSSPTQLLSKQADGIQKEVQAVPPCSRENGGMKLPARNRCCQLDLGTGRHDSQPSVMPNVESLPR